MRDVDLDDELERLFRRRVRLDRRSWACTVAGLVTLIAAAIVTMYALVLPGARPAVAPLWAAALALLELARTLKARADEAFLEFDRAARARGFGGAADFSW